MLLDFKRNKVINDYFHSNIFITFLNAGVIIGVLAFIVEEKEETLKENILKLFKIGSVIGVIAALFPLLAILVIVGLDF